MQTVRDIVTEAFWIAGIVALGRTPRASEIDFGAQALNDMLSAWAADGIDLEQAELTASDEPTFSEAYTKGVKYNLAAELAGGPFQVAMTTTALMVAADQKNVIRNALLALPELEFDDAPVPYTTNTYFY